MESYRKLAWGITIIIALLIIPLIVYFFFIKPGASPGPPETADIPLTTESKPGAPPPGEEDFSAGEMEPAPAPFDMNIPLSETDEPVRELVKDCSAHPVFPRWLENPGILRCCAAVVDNIAGGNSPAVHLHFMESWLYKQKFRVLRQNGKMILDPLSYKRYNSIARVVDSIDVETLALHFRQLRPLLEKAYRELGKPEQTFRETLAQALDVLLKTPVPRGDVLLEEKVTTYSFADPRLETLNDAQKHLLRMGPENIRTIKDKLREIKEKLFP